jgi:hypothetical protein
MTPEERQLITGLFDRMRGFALGEKDGEAEALINQQMTVVRDAPYMLVQSVLVQEHALREADNRIKALEEQVRALEGERERRPSGAGSFLGGLFGGGSGPDAAGAPARGASVPSVGARATPPLYDSRSAWTPPPQGGPQAGVPPVPGPQPGGGFLQNAMSTAAGVAGGMLLGSALGSLLGGHAHTATTHAENAPSTQEHGATTSNEGGTTDAAQHDEDVRQDALQDAADDDDGGWFGGDDGGLDI